VIVTDGLGCKDTGEALIELFEKARVSAGEDMKEEWGQEVDLFAQGDEGGYFWHPETYFEDPASRKVSFRPRESETFWVELMDTNGCRAIDSLQVLVSGSLYAPNVFTPDGDGINDLWSAKGEEIEEFPTEAEGDGGGSEATSTADSDPFTFSIDDIEECGQTCRDVTATLYNNQDEPASNVTVYTQIYAGNSTDESDQIWSGEQPIGDMEAGGSDTRTQRVELSTSDAFAVQQNDGWITVQTTVNSADVTITFQNQRNVT
jgi:hypothetical protein